MKKISRKRAIAEELGLVALLLLLILLFAAAHASAIAGATTEYATTAQHPIPAQLLAPAERLTSDPLPAAETITDTVYSVLATYNQRRDQAGALKQSWARLRLDPLSGAAGTTHHFFSDRFSAGEEIIAWLNTPDGVKPLDLHCEADRLGRVRLDFSSAGRRSGTYSLILYGARSNLIGAATFYVN
jgi:hypothetical protein